MPFEVHYSKLCDTDPKLYSKYLDVVDRHFYRGFNNGSTFASTFNTGVVWELGDDGSDMDQFKEFADSFGASRRSERPVLEVPRSWEHGRVFSYCDNGCRDRSSSAVVDGANSRVNDTDGKSCDVDLSGRAEGIRVRGFDIPAVTSSLNEVGDRDGADHFDGFVNDRSDCYAQVNSQKTANSNSGVEADGNNGHGKNWLRNQEWKKERKERKIKKKQMQQSWRKGSVSICDEKKPKGFFSECSDDVRRKLRESRAEALVAKNKLDAFNAEKKLNEAVNVSSEVELIQQMIKVTKLADQLKRNTKDKAIGGWAATVAESVTRSVAEKAPSSVPSLESVGYGKSALKSSDGSFVDSARLEEYNKRLSALENEYKTDVIVYERYEDRVFSLKHEFSDVALTPEERVRDTYGRKVAEKLVMAGVSPSLVDEALGFEVFY